jgi:CHAT domain-containing protein
VLPPAAPLAGQIERFAALLESGADPHELGRTLGREVLDSAVAALGPAITHLVIVPDGPLHRLPFDALRLADGRYAVERFAISVAPSAGVLIELRRRQLAHTIDPRPTRLLAFGDPVFAREEPDGPGETRSAPAYRSVFDATGGLPRLGDSGREARLVAEYAPSSTVRLRGNASESYLKHAPLDSFRVIHFATHAVVDESSVARTVLALSPGGGETGFVTPGDLAALRLDADLVVLSSCRSAGGVLVTGEGVQGLTAPLLEAGARAVVATTWRIQDRTTVGFVRDFYNALARGAPVGDALRAAKLTAIRRGASPAEWAAFRAIGDPFVRIPLQEPPSPSRWVWIALAGLGCIGAATYSMRHRTRRSRAASGSI